MPNKSTKFVRVLIVVQLLVAAWFLISPDVLPEPIRQAERQVDEAKYAVLDSIIVPLTYLQALQCLMLWRPRNITSWAYLAMTALIAGLGAFSGAAVLSAIDALFGYLQVLASGAMLGALWTSGYLSLRPQVSPEGM